MYAMPLMWIVWAVIVCSLIVLLFYRATLTRYEEDELFLDDASSHRHQANEAVLRKVARIRPLVRIFTGLTCLLTVAIIGIYVWDAIRQFYM